MRKSLVTLLVSLTLCGGATAAVIAAQPDAPRTPMMVAMVTPTMSLRTAAAPTDGGDRPGASPARGARGPARPMPTAAERAAMRNRMCNDRYARSVGQLAELEARLSLTPTQASAFAGWKDARLTAAKRHATECTARPIGTGANGGRDSGRNGAASGIARNPVERMAREETMLKARLTDLDAERPALEALYNSLTPSQRQMFTQHHRMGPRGGRMGRMNMRGMGPRGGMMMGMRGPMRMPRQQPNSGPRPDAPPPQ